MNELAARVLAHAIGGPGWMTLKTKRGFVSGPTVMFAYCEDCDGCLGAMGEWFQLKNAVWNQAWPGTAQTTSARAPLPMKYFLCIGCVEKRLGRRLSRRDFDMRRMINRRDKKAVVRPSKRMLDRLAKQP